MSLAIQLTNVFCTKYVQGGNLDIFVNCKNVPVVLGSGYMIRVLRRLHNVWKVGESKMAANIMK